MLDIQKYEFISMFRIPGPYYAWRTIKREVYDNKWKLLDSAFNPTNKSKEESKKLKMLKEK